MVWRKEIASLVPRFLFGAIFLTYALSGLGVFVPNRARVPSFGHCGLDMVMFRHRRFPMEMSRRAPPKGERETSRADCTIMRGVASRNENAIHIVGVSRAELFFSSGLVRRMENVVVASRGKARHAFALRLWCAPVRARPTRRLIT